jgi:hypothetical protein
MGKQPKLEKSEKLLTWLFQKKNSISEEKQGLLKSGDIYLAKFKL